jgi:hypothetical protein
VEEINRTQKQLLYDVLLFVMVRRGLNGLFLIPFPFVRAVSGLGFPFKCIFVVVKCLCNLSGLFCIRLLFFGTIAELILLQI